MTFAPHTRLSFIGTWKGDSEEIWETGLCVTGPGGDPVADLQDAVDGLETIVSDWFTSVDSFMCKSAQLHTIKAANIGPDGSYTEPPAMFDYTTPPVGAVTPNGPGFCSLAISFKSDALRPPGKYGRMYPPNNGVPVVGGISGSVFQTSTTTAQAVADAGGLLLTNLVVDLLIPVIASRVGSGSNTPIRTISCDTLLDTQRSRRNRITGTRQESIYSLTA
uniref:Uncharacterized protein n=1 Tax=uncultured prokaryote TaxID=198431 RepID=A0A0H5Q7E0_9ZZZZ|nr:hypothetical protein [uncultured prokaryote]